MAGGEGSLSGGLPSCGLPSDAWELRGTLCGGPILPRLCGWRFEPLRDNEAIIWTAVVGCGAECGGETTCAGGVLGVCKKADGCLLPPLGLLLPQSCR